MARPISPDVYQPPLHWYSHAWRMAGCLVLSAMVWGQAIEGQWQEHRGLFWLDLGLGLVAYALVFLRRRWPLPVALVTSLLSLGSGLAAGPATLASMSLATRQRLLPVAVVGAVGVIAAQGYADTQPLSEQDPVWLTFTVNVVATVALLGWGMYIGSRREMMWSLRDRVERAEAEQELRSVHARANERARIAREMHDVLAHRISQVSMHAGALAYRQDLTTEEMRTAAGVIQGTAHAALTDLRAVLGVLREHDGETATSPQPTYRDIVALVEESRAGGMNVEYDDLLPADAAISAGTGRTLYRIIQEGLTNARKHAPGALVRVQLSGSPEDGIDLLLRNPMGFSSVPAVPGARLGLVGLAERAQLQGGRLEHRRDGSTFVLHGWIPWPA